MDKPMKSIKLPGLDDTYTFVQEEDVAGKSGHYPDLTAGYADQLVSKVSEEDNTPYLFRTAGGSADIGEYENDMLVGGTVVWNQLVQNGNFATDTNWGNESGTTHTVLDNILTMTTTTANNGVRQNGFACVSGHKYLLSISARSEIPARVAFGTASGIGIIAAKDVNGAWERISAVQSCATNSANTPLYIFGRNTTLSNAQFKDFTVHDLTQMFGSTIADYIYSLETATEGSGIAWLKAHGFFTKDYYPYDAGTLMSVKTSAHKMVGFNAWDEEWEEGHIGTDGANASSGYRIRSKNYIPVIPNATYYFKSPARIALRYYNADKVCIASLSGETSANSSITIPDGASFLRFSVGNSTNPVTTYNHDICISLHWDGERDGEYEPYTSNTYPLSDIELRGLPKLDANNNLYYDGDTYESDGTVKRKYGVVDLGTLTWNYRGDLATGMFSTSGIGNYKKANFIEAICSRYKCVGAVGSGAEAVSAGEKTCSLLRNDVPTQYLVYVYDTAYTDATTFKTAMSGVYLVYELATPTTETTDPFQNPQIVDNWGTEEYIDEREVPIPVGHETKYPLDLRSKLETLPDVPDGNGDYILRQTNGANNYVPLVIPKELPNAPSANGNYKLRATTTNGQTVLTWEVDS